MTTLYDPQRERILAALEARQAEEEAMGYLDHPPDPPEDLRRPDPWYQRLWIALVVAVVYGWQFLRECWTGRCHAHPSCPRLSCTIRATKRQAWFWTLLTGAAILAPLILVGAWRWTS